MAKKIPWLCALALSNVVASAPNDFETSEYLRSGGLSLIQASSAYNRGYTGRDVIVAVMDTGIDLSHHKFQDKLFSGYDLQNNQPVSRDTEYHGTHVAGIIAAQRTGRGMHGVAYDAKILPVRILGEGIEEDAFHDAKMAQAIAYSYEHRARISNNSWGYLEVGERGYQSVLIDELSRSDLESQMPKQLSAYQEAVLKHDQVFVFAAGNLVNMFANQHDPSFMAALPERFPELKANWLAVVNVDQDGIVHESSHYCGRAKEWCLSAPGSDIFSTMPIRTYQRATGTSMAAPHVSGALAVLIEAFPNLSGSQLTQRLLVTADKSEQYADSRIYGAGLLNLDAATQPIGFLGLPIGSMVSEGTTALRLKQWFEGYAFSLTDWLSKKQVMVLDSFDLAPFYLPATALLEVRETPPPLTKVWEEPEVPYFQGDGLRFGMRPQNNRWGWQLWKNTNQQAGMLSYQWPLENHYFRWQSGTLSEAQQVLGFTLPKGVIRQTVTAWNGVEAGWHWDAQWKVLAGWQRGISHIQHARSTSSWLTFRAPLTTQSHYIGTQYEGEKHGWNFMLRQPLHVVHGKAHIRLPVGVTREGVIQYEESSVSLKSASVSPIIEMGYRYQWRDRLSFKGNLATRSVHDRTVEVSMTWDL